MKKAILLVSHGSYSRQAKSEVNALARRLKSLTRISIFELGFLEINKPDIQTGIERCAKKGATDITVLFNFLNSGEHVLRDIPRIVKKVKKRFPRLNIYFTPPIGQHSRIPALFVDFLKKQRRIPSY